MLSAIRIIHSSSFLLLPNQVQPNLSTSPSLNYAYSLPTGVATLPAVLLTVVCGAPAAGAGASGTRTSEKSSCFTA